MNNYIEVGDQVNFTPKSDPLGLAGVRTVMRVYIKGINGLMEYKYPVPVSKVKLVDLECGNIILTARKGEFTKV